MKVEIIHEKCGAVALYCDHRPYKGDVNIGGFTKLDGTPVIRGQEIYCPSCDRELWTISLLTSGRDLDHNEADEKLTMIHSLN